MLKKSQVELEELKAQLLPSMNNTNQMVYDDVGGLQTLSALNPPSSVTTAHFFCDQT